VVPKQAFEDASHDVAPAVRSTRGEALGLIGQSSSDATPVWAVAVPGRFQHDLVVDGYGSALFLTIGDDGVLFDRIVLDGAPELGALGTLYELTTRTDCPGM
jgi:hypothetical protein